MHLFDICMLTMEHFSFIFFNFISFHMPVLKDNFALRMFITYLSRMIGAVAISIIGVSFRNAYFMQMVVYISSIAMGSQASSMPKTLIWRFIQCLAIGSQIPSFAILGISPPLIILATTIAYLIAYVLSSWTHNSAFSSVIFIIIGYFGLIISTCRIFFTKRIALSSKINIFIYICIFGAALYAIQLQSVFYIVMSIINHDYINMSPENYQILYNNYIHYAYLLSIVSITILYIMRHLSLFSAFNSHQRNLLLTHMRGKYDDLAQSLYVMSNEKYRHIIYAILLLTYGFTHSFVQMTIACQSNFMLQYICGLVASCCISLLMHYKKRMLYGSILIILTIIRIFSANEIFAMVIGQVCITYAMNRGLRLLSSTHSILCIILYNVPAIFASFIAHIAIFYNHAHLLHCILCIIGIYICAIVDFYRNNLFVE